MLTAEEINEIEAEAAHYCCVSLSQFRERAPDYNIVATWFMGKKLYRREDLHRAIECASRPAENRQWQRSSAGDGRPRGRR